MSNLYDTVNTVYAAIHDPKGFDEAEIRRYILELRIKLTQPKWAIEDEALREECEKLLVSMAAQRYLADTKGSNAVKPQTDSEQ